MAELLQWVKSDPWRLVALLSVTALLALAALLVLGDESPAASPETTASGGTSSTSEATTTSGGGTQPAQPTEIGRRGGFVAVKIDNAPAARPQAGLDTADLVVEVPVEGGLTRFLAVYPADASGLAGPVRSLRPVDADLLPALSAGVVSTGGQPFVVREVGAGGVRQIDVFEFEWYISLGRQPLHDAFVDLEALLSVVGVGDGEEAPGLPSGELPVATEEASVIRLPIGSAEFRFQDEAYVRYESGEVFSVLAADGEEAPLSHRTLIVLFAAERPAGYQDANDAEVPTFDVIGSGDLMVFHDRGVHRGTWSRSAQADPFVFHDESGVELGIPDGPAYMAIVPRGQEVTLEP